MITYIQRTFPQGAQRLEFIWPNADKGVLYLCLPNIIMFIFTFQLPKWEDRVATVSWKVRLLLGKNLPLLLFSGEVPANRFGEIDLIARLRCAFQNAWVLLYILLSVWIPVSVFSWVWRIESLQLCEQNSHNV